MSDGFNAFAADRVGQRPRIICHADKEPCIPSVTWARHNERKNCQECYRKERVEGEPDG